MRLSSITKELLIIRKYQTSLTVIITSNNPNSLTINLYFIAFALSIKVKLNYFVNINKKARFKLSHHHTGRSSLYPI